MKGADCGGARRMARRRGGCWSFADVSHTVGGGPAGPAFFLGKGDAEKSPLGVYTPRHGVNTPRHGVNTPSGLCQADRHRLEKRGGCGQENGGGFFLGHCGRGLFHARPVILQEKRPHKPGAWQVWPLPSLRICGYLTITFFPFTTYTPAGSCLSGMAVRVPLRV